MSISSFCSFFSSSYIVNFFFFIFIDPTELNSIHRRQKSEREAEEAESIRKEHRFVERDYVEN